jgi:hypothetical protein
VRKLFVPIVILLILFEIANVYFIMPMPGSQRWNVVGLAHFLYSWRWPIRIMLYLLLALSIMPAFQKRRFLVIAMVLLAGVVTWLFNFRMTASNMFQPLTTKVLATAEANKIKPEKLVIGVVVNGDARAYPIEMIGYHHRVLDTVGGKSIFVTYCTVCRTGRVYEPVVNGKQETFRLVGMDHFNAMFEDKTTGTWWRQATGEACAGKLKGQFLPSITCAQMTLREWMSIHPNSKVLQWDTVFTEKYKRMKKFDVGNSGNKLTGSDTGSWKEKSWVLGIQGKYSARAYDWNWVKRQHFVIDTFEGKKFILWVGKDNMSFYSYYLGSDMVIQQGPADGRSGDTVLLGNMQILNSSHYFVNGVSAPKSMHRAPFYQEFWHSWRTFHPGSIQYPRQEK